MRIANFFLVIALLLAAQLNAQDVEKFYDIIGKNLGEVQLKKYIGSETETQRLSNWSITSKKRGIKIRAVYDRKRTDYSGKIYSIEFYFTRKGLDTYSGSLPFGLSKSLSWKKCMNTIKKHPDVVEFETPDNRTMTFKSRYQDQEINYEVSYPSGTSMQSFKIMVPQR